MSSSTSLNASAAIRLPATLLIAVAIVGAPTVSHGEDCSSTLPEDGAWVRYQWDWERLDNSQKVSGTVTVSLVGSVLDRSEPCRWIELKHEIPEGDEKGTLIQKLLIPEKDLLESSNPVEHVIRTWVRFNDEPVRLKDPKWNNDSAIAPLLLWTPGAVASSEKAGALKDIEYQRGRLEGTSLRTRKLVLSETNIDGRIVLKRSRTFTIRMHRQLPLGFAEAWIEDEVFDAEKAALRSRQISNYLLQDFGSGATTGLPDKH